MAPRVGKLALFIIGSLGFLTALVNLVLITHHSVSISPKNEKKRLEFITMNVGPHGKSFAPPQNLYQLRNASQASLTFCDACTEKCQNQILQRISNMFDATAIREAIKSETESDCTPCRSNCSCYLLQRIGYDEAAPEALRRSRTFTTLRSIPYERRVQNYVHVDETLGALSIYNPSIITIPISTKENLQLNSTKNPTYLVSFRVTNVAACGKEQSFDWRQHGVNLVSLAVVDQELNILDDILLDINSVIHLSSTAFEDYRLFVIDDIVYLSHGASLLPIQISSNGQGLVPYQNHTTRLVVSMLNQGNTPPFKVSVIRGLLNKGKNFQFFQDDTGETFVEVWPDHPHSIARLNVNRTVESRVGNTSGTPIISAIISEFSHGSNRSAPYDAFFVPRLPPFTNERGSACCVKLEQRFLPRQHAQNPYLYLGISHSRSKPKTNKKIYLSRIYVFEPYWPFDLIARSGPFCLGSSRVDEEPFQSFAVSRQLSLRRKTYDCPLIHYVSGMVATEDDTILITYGILDCFSRIVEVRKADLARMVFTNLNTSQQVV